MSFLKTIGNWFGFGGSDEQPPPSPTGTTRVEKSLLGARDHSPVKGLPNLISPLPITEEDHRRSLRLKELKEEFAKMNLNKQTGARSYSEANPDEESGNPRPRKRSRKDGRKRKSKKSKKSKKRKSNSRRRKRL